MGILKYGTISPALKVASQFARGDLALSGIPISDTRLTDW